MILESQDMTKILDVLSGHARRTERRFHQLEAKDLLDPDPRRGRQMEVYLAEAEGVYDLLDRLGGDAA